MGALDENSFEAIVGAGCPACKSAKVEIKSFIDRRRPADARRPERRRPLGPRRREVRRRHLLDHVRRLRQASCSRARSARAATPPAGSPRHSATRAGCRSRSAARRATSSSCSPSPSSRRSPATAAARRPSPRRSSSTASPAITWSRTPASPATTRSSRRSAHSAMHPVRFAPVPDRSPAHRVTPGFSIETPLGRDR